MTILKQSPPSQETKTRIQEKFYPLTPNVAKTLREANLTAAEWRFWSYLVEIDPFGERYFALDSLAAMQECQMSKTTLWRAMCKFQDLALFDFQDSGFQFKNETGVSKMKQPVQKRNGHFKNEMGVSKMKQEFQNCQNQPPESLKNQGCDSLQIIQTLQTNQTNQTNHPPLPPFERGDGGGEKIGGEGTEISGQGNDGEDELEPEAFPAEGLQTIASVVEKIPRAVVRQTTNVIQSPQIPQDLIDKLEELEIPLDERVRSAIAKHHLSQAYGAVAHVENTWESINNPRGVFLYQLPRQPVEAMGTRGRLRTARDFGFTLADIQKMYGANWRDAAAHFGVEVPQEDEEVRSSEGAARVFDSGVRSCLTSTPNSDEEVTP